MIVGFHYTLRDDTGDEIENNRDESPRAFLFGRGQVMPGIESAIRGKSAGDSVSVTLPPERAYGLPKPDSIQRLPTKYLVNAPKRLKPGMPVSFSTNQGEKTAVLVKVGKFNVDVDTNHPLAGKAVTFDIDIRDVRAATAEELAHGHAHGQGGHRH
jgi:FKBP-type peptidyl-prolyl cis-trans isomerase SlyD